MDCYFRRRRGARHFFKFDFIVRYDFFNTFPAKTKAPFGQFRGFQVVGARPIDSGQLLLLEETQNANGFRFQVKLLVLRVDASSGCRRARVQIDVRRDEVVEVVVARLAQVMTLRR